MPNELVTGNFAAGHALAVAGEANRKARGCACGIYPITPQTEIVEYVSRFKFTKGRVVPVESEHSAMAVCIGASLAGGRAFTASSSNGLAYMIENIFQAGYYRLPIVMAAVNRTLGPPWNIWADQGDTLAFRDAGWIQFYCEDQQDIHDTALLSFRVAEDHRVLLPALVTMDAFIVSHTVLSVDMATQQQADAFLPPLDLPHRMNHAHPVTIGGLAWPRETASQRVELDEAMNRVEDVVDEALGEFEKVFGRKMDGPLGPHRTEGADVLLITSGSIATTTRNVVNELRAEGHKVGLLKIKMFRPFPRRSLLEVVGDCTRIAVIDRNYSAGSGGIFWQEVAATLQGHRDVLVQGYLAGVGGGDVTPALVREIAEDIIGREEYAPPIWKEVAA
jgi:pyruvate/2-oxoacid:ferredoxin oxidoreductase alpha subunit